MRLHASAYLSSLLARTRPSCAVSVVRPHASACLSNLRSDASGDIGAVIFIGTVVAYHCVWNIATAAPNRSIQAKELTPYVRALERYADLFEGLPLSYGTDSQANVYGLTTGAMDDHEARPLLTRAIQIEDASRIGAVRAGFRARLTTSRTKAATGVPQRKSPPSRPGS